MISTRWVVLAGVLLLALVAGGRAAERTKKAEAPTASLQPRGTWWETMLASREGLADQEAAAERRVEADRLADPVLRQCQPFHIELNTQQEPRKIKVRIAGLERLYLGSAGQVDVFLGEPKLIARDGKSVPLSLAKAPRPTHYGSFLHSDQRNGWEPIVWGQQRYAAGFTMGNWETSIELDGQSEWLEGVLGVRADKAAGDGPVGRQIAGRHDSS